MLFSKPIADLKFGDVEEFCRRFREDVRVEYKSTFDDNVRKKLPRVLSSFANSYGGILIVGVNAPDGVPREPLEGIAFSEREPGLTVQNICRDGIFPEIPLYTSFVTAQGRGKAFLVAQVDESPKAPHAIENTTQVYVRSGDSAHRITLAKMDLLERLFLRRREVLGRWSEFFSESWQFAKPLNIDQRYAYQEIRIGPLYPCRRLLTRERIYDFLSNSQYRELAGFQGGQILRTPVGALLVQEQNNGRYLSVGELGTLHYVEPFYPRHYQGESKRLLDFWPIAVPILRLLRLSGALIGYAGAMCELRVEAQLGNISGQSFSSGMSPYQSLEIKTVAPSVQATAQASSHEAPHTAMRMTAELMYQLRWPFGAMAAPTRDAVRRDVEEFLKDV